jgi:hypothetical protein
MHTSPTQSYSTLLLHPHTTPPHLHFPHLLITPIPSPKISPSPSPHPLPPPHPPTLTIPFNRLSPYIEHLHQARLSRRACLRSACGRRGSRVLPVPPAGDLSVRIVQKLANVCVVLSLCPQHHSARQRYNALDRSLLRVAGYLCALEPIAAAQPRTIVHLRRYTRSLSLRAGEALSSRTRDRNGSLAARRLNLFVACQLLTHGKNVPSIARSVPV